MPARVAHSPQYRDQLIELPSNSVLDRLEKLERALASFPDMGSPLVRPSLLRRYGENVRKLVIDNYIVLYQHEGNSVVMLALLPASAIS